MKTQKLLKLKEKIIIVSDYREKKVIEYLKRLGAKVNEQALETGDFVASEKICIEKKTGNDFVSSIIDGRIFEQVSTLKRNFEKPIIIVEGYPTRKINENALKGAIASLLTDFGVSVLITKDALDTAKTIYWIAKKEQMGKGRGVSIKIGKKPKKIKKLQEFVVSSIPGISTKTADRLLQKFGSIKEIFNASPKDLEKIVGRKKAEKIWKIVNAKYGG
jgi:Fanconi anemia group M protein